MTLPGWIQVAVFFLVILALTKPLGIYLARVFGGEPTPLSRVLGPVERDHAHLAAFDAGGDEFVSHGFS